METIFFYDLAYVFIAAAVPWRGIQSNISRQIHKKSMLR